MKEKQRILTPEAIEMLESFMEDGSGYFYQMLDYLHGYIDEGVEEGRFTLEEAREDCEVACWYAYACNNIDEYEYYYECINWMPASEKNAAGCGAWYYRYAAALIYCGRLEEALEYAERGVKEEPDYPWGWLELARLRQHFGDEEGALAANAAGLALVPGDYEFLRQEEELKKGYSLDMLQYHFINEESDMDLLSGASEDVNSKLESVAGIICDDHNLKTIKRLLRAADWEADCPYCSGTMAVGGRTVEIVFRMNEAALSKLDADWIGGQLERIAGEEMTPPDGSEGSLEAIHFYRDKTVLQAYQRENGDVFCCTLQTDGTRQSQEFQYRDDDEAERYEDGDGGGAPGTEADEEEIDVPGMVKLYRRDTDKILYAECWPDGEEVYDHIVVHTGVVGDAGEVEHEAFSGTVDDYRAFLMDFRMKYGQLRYDEWPPEDMTWIAIQFPAAPVDMNRDGFEAAPEDMALRDLATELLNEALGWTGLGAVDGWEIGRTYGDPTKFVLNLFCPVVDGSMGLQVVQQTLSDNLDEEQYGQMKLAVRMAGEDDYSLVWAGDGSGAEDFSL